MEVVAVFAIGGAAAAILAGPFQAFVHHQIAVWACPIGQAKAFP